MAKVFVTVCNQGWVHRTVAISLLALLQDRRHRVRIVLPTKRPYENNLQHCVDDLIEGGEEFWLNFDADNPPTRNPLDLIEHDLDIVGCPTPVYHSLGDGRPFYHNAYKAADAEHYVEWPDRRGLQVVDAVGTGCVLFHRRVFERPALRYGAFQRTWRGGKQHHGNDIAFCRRARKAGLQIWAHFDYPCDHHVEISMNDLILAWGREVELGDG